MLFSSFNLVLTVEVRMRPTLNTYQAVWRFLDRRILFVVVVLYFIILATNVCLISRLISRMMTCVCASLYTIRFRNKPVHTHTRLVTLHTLVARIMKYNTTTTNNILRSKNRHSGLFLRKPANVATTRLKIFTLLVPTVAGVVLDTLGSRIVPLFHHITTGGFLFCS
jgi:hypothetical protein